MYIIIDSSHQLLYSAILSGNYSNIDKLHEEFEVIFRKNGVAHKYHWSKLTRNTKNKMKPALLEALKQAEKVNLNIIQHRKPKEVGRKEWFVNFLPTRIAQRLERWLIGKGGSMELIVDDDYNVVRGGRGTTHFIESLLRQTSLRLTNKEATIRKEEKLKMTLKQANGNTLDIYAYVASKNSKWVGLVDVYLGLYLSDKNLFSDMKNVYFVDFNK